MENNFFERMWKEAMQELAEGEGGWKSANPNVVTLACFGMLTNHITHRIAKMINGLKKPLWFASSAIAAGIIWYVASGILGL